MRKRYIIIPLLLGLLLFVLVRYFQFPSRYYTVRDFSHEGADDLGKCMHRSTLRKLDRMVEILGYKPRITSGARTPAHNAKVGGAINSAHLVCRAVDIALDGVPQEAIIEAAKEAGFERIGIYAAHIHVDDDPDKKSPATWYGTYA